MPKHISIPKIETYGDETLPAFGYELLRSILIPDLLGNDQDSILYWAGRKLARLYPLPNIEECISFFEKAGWGTLSLESESKDEMIFTLTSNIVISRIKSFEGSSFTLEAGFLSEQVERQTGFATQTLHEVKTGKQKIVRYTVKWDKKDRVIFSEHGS